jgi:hypothetical protein
LNAKRRLKDMGLSPRDMEMLVGMSQDCFGPSDFDREVQKHLNRYEKEKRKTKKGTRG